MKADIWEIAWSQLTVHPAPPIKTGSCWSQTGEDLDQHCLDKWLLEIPSVYPNYFTSPTHNQDILFHLDFNIVLPMGYNFYLKKIWHFPVDG